MIPVLSITAPVFCIILLGYLCARRKMFPSDAQKHFSLYVFYCAMPCYLFMAMAKSDPSMIANVEYILSFGLGLFGAAGLSGLVASKIYKLNLAETILAMMAGCYTNSAFVGIPIIVMAFGEPGPVVVVALFQLIVVTTLILTSLEIVTRHGSLSVQFLHEFPKTIIKNPIVGSAMLGILFSILSFPIPDVVSRTFDLLGAAGIPTALFALGLSLGGEEANTLKKDNKLVYLLVFIKNFIHPLFAGLIGYFVFDLPELWLGALLVVSAMPAAMNNFVFAQRYGVFTSEASQVVFISSVLSLFTLSGLLWLLTL